MENRAYLALMGLLAVGLGMAIALGLTMAVGLYYTTVHGVMAFLVLGIGIDDMFVIVQGGLRAGRLLARIPGERRRKRSGAPSSVN